MILSFLFAAFLAYLLFKLVVNFIIPIYRTTKKVRKSFQEMQEKMQEQQNGYQSGNQSSQNGTSKKSQQPLGDYIDFEEVKE